MYTTMSMYNTAQSVNEKIIKNKSIHRNEKKYRKTPNQSLKKRDANKQSSLDAKKAKEEKNEM